MTANFTTLALNLLISERPNHRSFFASKIVDLLDSVKDNSEKERQIKIDFIAVIYQCTQDPTSKFRDVFYHYSEYYNAKLANPHSFQSAA